MIKVVKKGFVLPLIILFSFVLLVAAIYLFLQVRCGLCNDVKTVLMVRASPSLESGIWKTYTNSKYSFKYPSEFEHSEFGILGQDQNATYTEIFVENKFGFSVAVNDKEYEIPIPDDAKSVQISGETGYISNEGKDNKIFLVVHNKTLYSLSFSNGNYYTKEQFDKLTDLILSTFKFTDTNENLNGDKETSAGSIKKASTLKKIKEDDRFVYYDGSITIRGKYQEHSPENVLGLKLCFYVDNETSYLIPRDDGDSRTPWFCFNNQNAAKEMLGINDAKIFSDKTIECIQGMATVKASNYIVDKLEGEVWDTANLNRIISAEKYTTECN